MSSSIYYVLFEHLSRLVPSLHSLPRGTVLRAGPLNKYDITLFLGLEEKAGDMAIIDIGDCYGELGTPLPSPWLRLRVDTRNRLAEVLEMEDTFGYLVVYQGKEINPQRSRINLFAMNWLKALTNCGLVFECTLTVVPALR